MNLLLSCNLHFVIHNEILLWNFEHASGRHWYTNMLSNLNETGRASEQTKTYGYDTLSEMTLQKDKLLNYRHPWHH